MAIPGIEKCPDCNGSGFYIASQHHPSCEGDCREGVCPIPEQRQCERCEGCGEIDINEEAPDAREEN